MIRWLQQLGTDSGVKNLGRGILLAATVGAVAGLGALAFQMMTHAVSLGGLDFLAGYRQGTPDGEHAIFQPTSSPFRLWVLVALPVVGGLISGFLVYKFAPEAEGHGTDACIDAYHNKRGQIRGRVPLIKMLASAVTMGTGGSGGREGPIAQIGAGFGSFLATKLKLSDVEHRTLMAAGVGAGIGAIFQAPLAGAIFATEVLYSDPDFEAENLIPAFIATTVAYCMFNFGLYWLMVLIGLGSQKVFEPLFSLPGDIHFNDPFMLIPLSVLAVVAALASGLYVKMFYGMQNIFKKLRLPNMIKPAIGAFLTGLVALVAYLSLTALGPNAQHSSLNVLSYGYGVLQDIFGAEVSGPNQSWMHTESPRTLIIVLLVIAGGKMLTTSLTIGSGGSGGVFGPSMVIGGALGAAVGLIFKMLLPDAGVRVDVFAILGMASFFAAAANTPVSTLLIVSEMTAGYALLLPSMWVCAIAYLIGRRWKIFSEQVPTRLDSPAHRGDFIIDILQGLNVSDAFGQAAKDFVHAPLDMRLRDMARLITDSRQTAFPVIDEDGNYYGLFGLNDIRRFLYDSGDLADLTVAEDLAATDCQPITLQMSLSDAISRFARDRFEELPVVDEAEPKKVIGLLRRQDLIATYNARLLEARQSRQS